MIQKTRPRLTRSLESLERRDLLSATPTLVGDFSLDAPIEVTHTDAYWLNRQSDNAWLHGELFFAADDGSGDVELWKSDGTEEGTIRVADIRPGVHGSLPRNFKAIPGRVLFTAYTQEHGRELWTTDGTEAGTVLVKDLTPGPESSTLGNLRSEGDQANFCHNGEQWVTDGTAANTKIAPPISNITSVGDQLFLIEGNSLWTIDSKTGEKHIVKEFEWIDVQRVPLSNSKFLFFRAQENDQRAFWVSDGTTEGTRILTLVERWRSPVVAGEFVFYKNGSALWSSDGTPEGTQRIRRFYPLALVPVGDKIFFLSSEPGRLYQSDGTPEGTSRVNGADNVIRQHLHAFNGQLYFIQLNKEDRKERQ